ncbi:hypothetical protein [Agromyces aerolatus]|uniref:hypothetical protein n=1 Tax=Agromyces sp. LY-1074 TaxID=3074080 RepID=UPI00285F3559|nr:MULTISPECIES: hypothetical protein [unclassified Agromyces]MDR5701955.1 hypothetical protein [Agromyces sp. LY-1074]MDR5708182.1 hypothetical protein [Agromyces sp. LY-1358]
MNGQDYVTRANAWDDAYQPFETTLELPNVGAFTDLQDRTLITSYTYTVDGQQASVTYPAVIKADETAEDTTILGAETVTIYAGEQEIEINATGHVTATRYYAFAGQTVALRTGKGLGESA